MAKRKRISKKGLSNLVEIPKVHAASAHRIKLQNDINTDYIISGRYKFRIKDTQELGKYVFNDIDPDFHKKIKPGDFLIAGDNFGCGSSREQAPLALKACGLAGVIAKSFARIFYRNAFNVGLLILECNTNYIDDGDAVEYIADLNIIKNLSKGLNIDVQPIPPLMKRIIADGGVISHIKKHGGFRIEI